MGNRINDDMDMAILDDSEEEKELLSAYQRGKLIPVENQEEMRRKLRQAAKATIEKARHVSIRVTEKDLRKIKAKAVATGIPYHTLLGSLLHQYADGKVSFSI
ncbi:MAG TPA: antitoxin [Candidatus Kapabacteria bacterium]|nr:antitoxin [Candidatus Kapabacteria bacterium]